MAQPKGAAKKGNAPASATAAPPAPAHANPAGTADKDSKSIRTVGPTFIPAR
jgi:hypothetical protein